MDRRAERAHIDNQIDECIEIGDRAPVADFGVFDAQFLSLTVDALTGGALAVDRG